MSSTLRVTSAASNKDPQGFAPVSSAMRSSLYSASASGSRDGSSARDSHRQQLMRQDEASLERENDEIINALGSDVDCLKRVAEGMRDDVKEHNTFLDSLSNRLTSAAGGVRMQAGRIDTVMRQYGCKHSIVIGAAICSTVLLLYYIVHAVASAKKQAPATP